MTVSRRPTHSVRRQKPEQFAHHVSDLTSAFLASLRDESGCHDLIVVRDRRLTDFLEISIETLARLLSQLPCILGGAVNSKTVCLYREVSPHGVRT